MAPARPLFLSLCAAGTPTGVLVPNSSDTTSALQYGQRWALFETDLPHV